MKDPLARLVGELSRLPGIGAKTATRMAYHILRSSEEDAEHLSAAILDVKKRLFHCSSCFSITAEDPCSLCTDPERERERICVVEEAFNIRPIEQTGEYRGLYHVLMGALSPQRGIGPDELTVDLLLSRLDGINEVILATNPDVEGEATALFLARLLKARNIPVTRLAFGLPVGGDIDFADEVTLARSLSGRHEM